MTNKQEKPPINEKYHSQNLNSIQCHFENCESQKDINVLNYLFFNVMDDKVKNGITVKTLLECTQELPQMIDLRTNSIESCNIKIDKGEGPDSANSMWNFKLKPYYFNYELFGYLHRKNRLDYNLKITRYDQLFNFKN